MKPRWRCKTWWAVSCNVNINQHSETVSMTLVSCLRNLFGPNMVQKLWDYRKDFTKMLKRSGKKSCLFHLKESKFGLLSLSCAIFCLHWDNFRTFLDTHNHVTNKLKCLVRDGIENDYVKVVICVISSYGVHLVIPYHF